MVRDEPQDQPSQILELQANVVPIGEISTLELERDSSREFAETKATYRATNWPGLRAVLPSGNRLRTV